MFHVHNNDVHRTLELFVRRGAIRQSSCSYGHITCRDADEGGAWV